ncbi:MAG: T9SS type A sorting domain-containing protein [Bacteroidota bacterium]
MKKPLLILCYLFFLFFSNNLFSQCEIGDIEINVSPCLGTDTVIISIDFEYAGVSNQFNVSGNGNFYGTFSYDQLPITIMDIFPECDTEYEFVVTDVVLDCSNFDDGIEICCEQDPDCTLNSFWVSEIECQGDNLYSATFFFDYQNPDGSGFDIFLNGSFLRYVETNEPFRLNEIPIDDDEFFQIFQICENDNPGCCEYFFLQTPVCESNSDCFQEIVWEYDTDCSNGDSVLVFFDFEYDEDVVTEAFKFFIFDNLVGTYLYSDLPISIPFVANCDFIYDLKIQDQEIQDCVLEQELRLCCNPVDTCGLAEAQVEFIECDLQGYWVSIALTFDPNTIGESFQVNLNGNFIGSYNILELPQELFVPFTGNDVDIFTICQNNLPFCCKSDRVEVPCDGNTGCDIDDLAIEFIECDTSNNTFYAVIDFETESTSDSFELYINQELFDVFPYTLPITVGPIEDTEEIYRFLVKDQDNPRCQEETRLRSPECGSSEPCEIGDLVTLPFACDDEGNYKLYLNFHYENDSSKFDIFVDGEYFSSYFYTQLPLIFGSFEGNGEQVHILIQNQNNPDCVAELEYIAPDCNPCDNCEISELTVQVTPCISDSFFVVINFEYEEVGDNGFTIRGNGNNYGSFEYDDLPIFLGPLASNCDEAYEFVIIDNEHPDCKTDTDIGIICCNNPRRCNIRDLNVEVTECENRTINAVIDFNHSFPITDYFNIYMDDLYLGSAQYFSLPIELGPIPVEVGTNNYTFYVIDSLNQDCLDTAKIEITCERSPTPAPRQAMNVFVNDNLLNVELQVENEGALNVLVINANGQIIHTFQNQEALINHQFPMSLQQNGTYMVRVVHDNYVGYKKFTFIQ